MAIATAQPRARREIRPSHVYLGNTLFPATGCCEIETQSKSTLHSFLATLPAEVMSLLGCRPKVSFWKFNAELYIILCLSLGWNSYSCCPVKEGQGSQALLHLPKTIPSTLLGAAVRLRLEWTALSTTCCSHFLPERGSTLSGYKLTGGTILRV